MAEKTPQGVEDLLTVYKTLLLDLPLAGAKWGLGMGKEKELTEAAWKGYDAWVRLTRTSVDGLYRNPLFGDLLARSLEGILRWQRLSTALAGAFFAGLWQAVGLPKAAEVQALQAVVQALREDLHSLSAGLPAHAKEREAFIELDVRMEALQVKMKEGNGAVAATLASA